MLVKVGLITNYHMRRAGEIPGRIATSHGQSNTKSVYSNRFREGHFTHMINVKIPEDKISDVLRVMYPMLNRALYDAKCDDLLYMFSLYREGVSRPIFESNWQTYKKPRANRNLNGNPERTEDPRESV